jgi:hypothetical protein
MARLIWIGTRSDLLLLFYIPRQEATRAFLGSFDEFISQELVFSLVVTGKWGLEEELHH